MSEEQRVNWVTVINFLEKEYSQISIREKEWQYEKEMLTQRISGLEAELRSNAIVCENLVNRIKILEIALKQEKSKHGHGKTTADSQQISGLLEKFNLNKQAEKCTHDQFLKDFLKDFKIFGDRPKPLTDRVQSQVVSCSAEKKMVEKRRVGAHLDIVTNLVEIQVGGEQLVASASEDCLIKLWTLSSLLREEHPEPKHILRNHMGPLFSLTAGPSPTNKTESLLFSGGFETDIKSWRIDGKGARMTGSWRNGTEQDHTIWQLSMLGDKLLSSSSDGMVRMFNINDSHNLELTMIKQYREKQFNQTAIKWISSQNFMTGCSSAPRILLWNVDGRLQQKYLYEGDKDKKNPMSIQVNKLEFAKDLKLVIGGCEDGVVRLFDYNSSKVIKKLQASAAVSTVLTWDWQIASGDHKGSLHIWDARTFKLLDTKQQIHLRKYQTGLTCGIRSANHLLTSGADGIIKIFS